LTALLEIFGLCQNFIQVICFKKYFYIVQQRRTGLVDCYNKSFKVL
jgi:hypothetical protein